MTVKGGTSQACAACKFRRRKCSSECPLAPYFPPDQPKMFQNAHRLFGVSNILKILEELNQTQKMEAVRSIVYQANLRDRFPVHGCWGFICQLRYQIQQAEQELNAVNAHLAICRQHHHQQISPSSQLQLGTASPNNALQLFQNHHPHQPYNSMASGISLAPLNSFSNGNSSAAYNTSGYIDSKDNIVNNNNLWVQNHPYNNNNGNNNNNNNNNSLAIQSQLVSAHALPIQHQATETPQDYDEMPSFFDTIDDRQSYMDSKEAFDSSPESSSKDMTQSIEHISVSKNELKSAAACFSLTSVN